MIVDAIGADRRNPMVTGELIRFVKCPDWNKPRSKSC